MKINKSISIPRVDYITVAQLKKYLAAVPDNAKISFSKQPGDYNQMDYYSASIFWDEEL